MHTFSQRGLFSSRVLHIVMGHTANMQGCRSGRRHSAVGCLRHAHSDIPSDAVLAKAFTVAHEYEVTVVLSVHNCHVVERQPRLQGTCLGAPAQGPRFTQRTDPVYQSISLRDLVSRSQAESCTQTARSRTGKLGTRNNGHGQAVARHHFAST